MKIICSTCKKELGVQRPYNDSSENSAKCLTCFKKEKEEACKPQPLPEPGERKDITFASGLKGFLTVAGVDSPNLSICELMVSGKTFACFKEARESFLEHLELIDKDEVDITYLYSMSIVMPPTERKRKKAPLQPADKKPADIHYNCTVTMPKYYAISMFDDKRERVEKIVDIIARGVLKEGEAREEK